MWVLHRSSRLYTLDHRPQVVVRVKGARLRIPLPQIISCELCSLTLHLFNGSLTSTSSGDITLQARCTTSLSFVLI